MIAVVDAVSLSPTRQCADCGKSSPATTTTLALGVVQAGAVAPICLGCAMTRSPRLGTFFQAYQMLEIVQLQGEPRS